MRKSIKVVAVVMLVAIGIAMSGCQSADAMRNDMVGALNYVGETFLKPMSEKAQKRDADISAKKLATYHAEKASLYVSYANAEVE
jgi:hypothetical protein